MLGMVADFGRINRRMHNKSFTADGQIAIVGGRNIGDEYLRRMRRSILPISTWWSSAGGEGGVRRIRPLLE
jgi:hypothetical protein